jgi:hypothetical protein
LAGSWRCGFSPSSSLLLHDCYDPLPLPSSHPPFHNLTHVPFITQEGEKEVNTDFLLLSSFEVPLVIPYPNVNCLETSKKPPSLYPYLLIQRGELVSDKDKKFDLVLKRPTYLPLLLTKPPP